MNDELKNTKAAFEAVFALGEVIINELKDGLQAQDILDIFGKLQNDKVLAEKLSSAWNGKSQIKTEMTGMNFMKGFGLFTAVFPLGMKFLDSLQNGQPQQQMPEGSTEPKQ